MTAWRRVGTILGWSAGVCAALFVVWAGYLYAFVDGWDASDPGSGGMDVPFTVLSVILFVSPFIGGIIGLVKTLRGAVTRDKVIWSLIGLVVMVAAWYALAGLAVLIMNVLPDPN